MSSERIIGTETEYGVYRPGDAWANPIALSTKVVTTYGEISRDGTPAQGAGVVRWDYTGEDPLNDLRGMRMSRAAADPSLLTDDPYHLAPSGGSERVARPTPEELALPAATTAVLTNGARLYVDHAHPEYSAPETIGARDALLWDRAGEVIAQRVPSFAGPAASDAGRRARFPASRCPSEPTSSKTKLDWRPPSTVRSSTRATSRMRIRLSSADCT